MDGGGGAGVMMSLIKLPRLHKAPKGADLITTKEGEERGEEVAGRKTQPHFLPCPVYKIHYRAPLRLNLFELLT